MEEKTVAQRMEEAKEIVNRLMFDRTIIDNHNCQETTTQGVALMESGYVCPVSMCRTFCLNPLYIGNDGKVHLSCTSVGGTFYGKQICDPHSVMKYNDTTALHMSSGKVKQVVVFY